MRAFIYIDGSESELLNLSYSTSREVGENGQINSRFKKANISVTKDSAPMKAFMTNWMSEQDQEKEVEIIIYEDDLLENVFKYLKVENARIYNYSESFDRDGNARPKESFQITGQIINIGASQSDAKEFHFRWPVNS